MSRYYKIGPQFWSDPSMTCLEADGQLLAFYVLTCPHRSTEGLFRLPKPYAMADLGWTPERLAEPFNQLLACGFIEYDDQAQVCLLVKALKWQAPQNPNQVTAALNAVAELPPTPLIARFYALSEQFCQRLAEGLQERFAEHLAEGFAHPLALALALAPAPEHLSSEVAAKNAPDRPEVARLCDLLAEQMRTNDPKAKTSPESKAWRDPMRLLLDRDGRDVALIEQVIRWSQTHNFWRSNIRSPQKLRNQFPALFLQMGPNGTTTNGQPSADFSKYDLAAAASSRPRNPEVAEQARADR